VQCNAAAASWQASAIAAVQQQPVFQLAASVIGGLQQFINVARDKFSQAFPQLQNVDKQVIKAVVAL
jgi:chitinase